MQQKMWHMQRHWSSSFSWLYLLCNKTNEILKCDSRDVIYLISCKCCVKQYLGSATSFKERFRIRKSDINTGKVRCGVANHPHKVSHSSASKFEYLQVQLIQKVSI